MNPIETMNRNLVLKNSTNVVRPNVFGPNVFGQDVIQQHVQRPNKRRHGKHRQAARRRGAVMVEFAVVAPLLFLFFFAAFEFCRVAMIRHTADNAVYEACRVGIIPGATASEVRAEAMRIMNTLGVTDLSLVVTPASIDEDSTEVTVRLEVPMDENSFVPTRFVAGRSLTRELTLRREGNR